MAINLMQVMSLILQMNILYDSNANACTFSQKWAELGLKFSYNEFRTSYKLGGQPLVQRLGDKSYSWSASALLIPDMVAAGLLGHAYTCPDMIGVSDSCFYAYDAIFCCSLAHTGQRAFRYFLQVCPVSRANGKLSFANGCSCLSNG